MTRTSFRMSLLALSLGMAFSMQAQAALGGQRDAIERLSAESGGSAKVSIHRATGAASFVRVAPGSRLAAVKAQGRMAAPSDAVKEAGAVQFLTNYGSLFGIADPAAELVKGATTKDRQGGTHIRHKQVYQGVPVFGAELKSHFDAPGNLVAVSGTFVPGINVKSTPTRTAAEAATAAVARVQADLTKAAWVKIWAGTPTLMVYREGLAKGVEGANRLAWLVEVGNRVNVREFVFVDAHTGKVIEKFNGIHDAKNRRAFDGQGAVPPYPNYPANPFWVEGQGFPTGTTEADNMIEASSEIYDLFKKGFGRDSFDGNGATMDSIFNRGNGCPNASWNGVYISFCPGTTTDDITAHEWAHAYTEYTHGLIYAWQPGALNEAYSDIWGETVDRINTRGAIPPDAARTAGSCTVFSTAPPTVTVTEPPAIAGPKSAGSAAFGPSTFSLAATDVVVVNDGDTTAGSTTTDGCTAPFVNAAAIAGKIAFIDRGVCGFTIKVKNAQNAGAIGVIVGDNSGGNAVAGMGGADATITIPSLRISQNNGTAIKASSGVRAGLQAGPGTDNSVRWLMGEDSTGFIGAIRDMYTPTCYGNPGKVSDTQYVCTFAGDNGGVHSNSGVPNHAYALLVDGGSYNGQNISAIGLTKAAHIYYRAQTVYQGPASGFPEHADAIEQSCSDLTGATLADLKTGLPSGEIINGSDCAQVAKAAIAVELRTPPTQCGFTSLLAKNPPPLCESGSPIVIAGDTFEGGKRNSLKWLVSTFGTTQEFIRRNFGVTNKLPSGRTGSAIFASDPNIENCVPGDDQSGGQRLESPEITIPAGATAPRMSFDHWVATEEGWDGGNLKISVNGGAWQLISAANFIYNPYNLTMNTAGQGNTSPLAGQPGFSGGDGGKVDGSWGRSIINLQPYATAGDKVKIRFEAGNDGCGGTFGWYIDDVSIFRCTAPQ